MLRPVNDFLIPRTEVDLFNSFPNELSAGRSCLPG